MDGSPLEEFTMRTLSAFSLALAVCLGGGRRSGLPGRAARKSCSPTPDLPLFEIRPLDRPRLRVELGRRLENAAGSGR